MPPSAPNDPQRFLETDQLDRDLRGRSARGGVVTLSAQGMKFALQIGSTMVLARLLTPADYGLIGMVAAFTGFVGLLKDAGLSMATVQRDTVSHAQVSTLFWFNVGISVGATLLMAALAPLVALFYGEPSLTGITLVLAATILFGGLTTQHQAILRRQMRFTHLAAVEVLSMAGAVTLAIVLAALGAGYWALVANLVAMAAFQAIGVWIACGWRPGRAQRGAGAGSMLKFGGFLFGFNTVNFVARNADNVIIGSALGASSLGVYSKAYSLLTLPMVQIKSPIGAVVIPALSRKRSDKEGYRRAYRLASSQLAMVVLPIVGAMVALAEPLVAIVLGPQWGEAAFVFKALGPAAALGGLGACTGWVYITWGHVKRQFWWSLFVGTPLVVASFFAGLPWGIHGVAVAYSIAFTLRFLLSVPVCFRGTPITQGDLYSSIWLPLVTSLAGVGAAQLAPTMDGPILQGLVTGSIYGVVVGGVYVLCRERLGLSEVPGLVLERFRKRPAS